VFLAVGDDGNGCGVDIQCRRANQEIRQLSDRRQTERRPSTRVDVPFSHCLQHESRQEVISRSRSKINTGSCEKQKETIKYDRIPILPHTRARCIARFIAIL